MTDPRRFHFFLAAAVVAVVGAVVLSPGAVAARQTPNPTTTTPATSTIASTTTVRPTTSTTGQATSTTVAKPDEGRFNVTPRAGTPGVTIRITDVVPKCPMPAGKTVLVAIGMGSGRAYGSHIIATASTSADGGWGGTVIVPDIPSGTYEMYASCFVQHPGQYDDELLLPYSGPTFTVMGSPIATSTSLAAEPASKKSDTSPWLALGIVIAVVIALAAIIYAFIMRSRVSHGRPPRN